MPTPAASPELEYEGGLTDIEGIRLGHATDPRRPTGCTVVVVEQGAVPYFEFADGEVQVVRQYDDGSDSIIKNKIRNFVEAADPGFFQDGGVVIKMKRVQPAIAIDQQYEKAENQVRENSFHKNLWEMLFAGRGTASVTLDSIKSAALQN